MEEEGKSRVISSVLKHVLDLAVRPPLRKKLFPVNRVGKKKASREVGNFFFFPNLIFYKLECTGGESEQEFFFENREKKVPVDPF